MGGKRRDRELMLTGARKFTSNSEELHLLDRYYYLLVNTDYLREAVYGFFVDGKSYEQLTVDFKIHKNYVRNVIYKEVKRLFEEVTEDPFALITNKEYEIGDNSREQLVDVLINRIERMIKNQKTRRFDELVDYMLVDLKEQGEFDTEYNGKIDEQEFGALINRLQYLSKPYLDSFFDVVDKKMVGYIAYLLTTSNRKLSERDKAKKQEICEVWFLPYEER